MDEQVRVSVRGLWKSPHDEQWAFTVQTTEPYADGPEPAGQYETNIAGEGLFSINEETLDRKQITGTCQFSLRGCTKGAARQRIVRFFQ